MDDVLPGSGRQRPRIQSLRRRLPSLRRLTPWTAGPRDAVATAWLRRDPAGEDCGAGGGGADQTVSDGGWRAEGEEAEVVDVGGGQRAAVGARDDGAGRRRIELAEHGVRRQLELDRAAVRREGERAQHRALRADRQ